MSRDVFSVCSDLVDESAEASPVRATYAGIAGHDDRWDDFSVEGGEARRALLASQLKRVRAIPDTDDAWAGFAKTVAAAALEDEFSRYETAEHLRDLNSVASPLQDMYDVFDHMAKETAEDWETISARLGALPAAMEGYRRSLEEGRRRGLAVARRQVLEAIRQARNYAGEGSSFRLLEMRGVEADIGGKAADGLATAATGARAAFSEFAAYLERDYLPSAGVQDAVGEERYLNLARRHLGSVVDPSDVYSWGWSEVERVRSRMDEMADGIAPGASLQEVITELRSDPERAAPVPEFLQLMAERQEAAVRALDGIHFDVPEAIGSVEVAVAPPGGPLGVYYVPPSEDFSRRGCVWWSLGDRESVPLFDQMSTAYHEGFPGHHLQLGFQMCSPVPLSRYHRLLVWYPGSGEGWALYAEDLMEELGFLERPDYVMGKLASEMLRACRVVIDIGSHLSLEIPGGQPFHPGEPWTFDAGVEMLIDYAAQDAEVAVTEMNRYLGWPGQAISYKVGQRAISDLRGDAERRHGGAFDLKAFHARLLEAGAVGLDVLRSYMVGF
jgi:uncharacterized protein (DUF885 family)